MKDHTNTATATTAAAEKVRVINAALDESEDGSIVLRGVLTPDALPLLKADAYQREILYGGKHTNLRKAHIAGKRVPDIELAVRHDEFEVSPEDDGEIAIPGPVYMVDGLQRVSSAIDAMKEKPGLEPRIGFALYFNTTEQWERERFKTLNADRIKVSPNVLLRNMRQDFQVVDVLFGMTTVAKDFALYKRVSWMQHKGRGELINANTLLYVANTLMERFGPSPRGNIIESTGGAQKILEKIGPAAFRKNVATFFETIDSAFGIRNIVYTEKSPQVYYGFLMGLALTFSKHQNFWDGKMLTVSKEDVRRLATFPIRDPSVVDLAGGSRQAANSLSVLIVDHMNYNRTTNRLRRWED